MNKTIDLSYKEISDNQEGKYLFGISTQTVQNAIKALEDKYFKGWNIFRKDDKTSSYSFRWEIAGLSKLLIWLEVSDVFNEKRTQKSGNAEIDIGKIIDEYKNIFQRIPLKEYERIELENFSLIGESKEILEYVQMAYQVIANFLILASIGYNKYPHTVFKDIVEKFDVLTESLNEAVYLNYKSGKIGMSCLTETEHGVLISEKIAPLTLNLKVTVADAIKRIADQIYDFDSEGTCRRKKKFSKKDDLQSRYLEILKKHAAFVPDAGYIEMMEDALLLNGGIENIRQEIDDFMNDYFKSIHPSCYRRIPFDIDEIDSCLRQPLKNYIIHYCWMHLFCSGKITESQWIYDDPPEKCYDVTLKEREAVSNYDYRGFRFNDLAKIEEDVREIVDNIGNLSNYEPILDVVDNYVDQYAEVIKIHQETKKVRFERVSDGLQSVSTIVDDVKDYAFHDTETGRF